MSKQSNSQSLIAFVKRLDKINDLDVDLKGDIKKILKDPISWATAQAEEYIKNNQDKYLEAKKLGKEFFDEIENISRG
jgi:hypothetical protein